MKFSNSARLVRRCEIWRLTQQTAQSLTEIWPAVVRAFVNTLMPPCCQACGCSIAGWETWVDPEKTTMDADLVAIFRGYLCKTCMNQYTAVQSPQCIRCGKMFMGRQGPDHLCQDCIRNPWQFTRVRSAGIFDQSLATLIYQFKYNGRTSLAQPLGKLMLEVLRKYWQPTEIDQIVPIPLHPKRLRTRGFNQSMLLVTGLG